MRYKHVNPKLSQLNSKLMQGWQIQNTADNFEGLIKGWPSNTKFREVEVVDRLVYEWKM